MRTWLFMVAALLVLIWLVRPTQAHEFYDPDCCDDRDCRPAYEGEVVERPDGWRVTTTKQTFPFDH